MSAKTSQELRAHWESNKYIWRWLVISVAALGFLIIFFAMRQFELNIFQFITSAILGAIGWQLAVMAIQTLIERYRTSDLTDWTSYLLILFIGAFAGVAVYSSAILTLSTLLIPAVIGGPLIALAHALRKARDVHQPRCFVEIANTGDVIELKKGTPLIKGLEAAGYKLLTQCNAQGECATCRVKILNKNQVFVDKNYGPVLTPRQKNEGWAIACQVPVEGDMRIQLYKPLMLRWPIFNKHDLSPLARELRLQLPGFDCEACGYLTCDQYAQAIATGKAAPDGCFPGGVAVTGRLKQLLSGVESARK